jgi:hypothetical protein
MNEARQELVGAFLRFARTSSEEPSPLYEHLKQAIVQDEELLWLAAQCQPGQPQPNMLFGAVHFLLLRAAAPLPPLARFYADLTAEAAPPEQAFPHFRAFCLEHQAAIIHILQTRMVQTNEVRRCAYLLPAFCWIAARTRRPLALVEIGTSAGLNLLWDHYSYQYHHDQGTLRTGATSAPVQINTDLHHNIPDLPLTLPHVISRAGLDLNVIDLHNPLELLWLRALIWPEHAERMQRLDAAMALLKREPPRLITGDALLLLPKVLRDISVHATPVIFHTHVLNQFSGTARERLTAIMEQAAQRRDVFRLGNDMDAWHRKRTSYPLRLIAYEDGSRSEYHLADCDAHGRWVSWLV